MGMIPEENTYIYIPRGVATKTESHSEINAIADGSNLALYTSP